MKNVRSKQIHTAIAQGNSRFEICQLVSKGVRITHKHGTRMEDSISHVLGILGTEAIPPGQPSPVAGSALKA